MWIVFKSKPSILELRIQLSSDWMENLLRNLGHFFHDQSKQAAARLPKPKLDLLVNWIPQRGDTWWWRKRACLLAWGNPLRASLQKLTPFEQNRANQTSNVHAPSTPENSSNKGCVVLIDRDPYRKRTRRRIRTADSTQERRLLIRTLLKWLVYRFMWQRWHAISWMEIVTLMRWVIVAMDARARDSFRLESIKNERDKGQTKGFVFSAVNTNTSEFLFSKRANFIK